nr:vWA domain-containing protein [uncultured Dongia sp.]
MNIDMVTKSDHATVREDDIEQVYLSQAAASIVQVDVPAGQNIVRVPVTAGEVIQLPFPADDLNARLSDDNGNLAIKSGDVTIILQGYTNATEVGSVEIVGSDGEPVDVAATIASTDPSIDIQTAAGPAAGDAGDGPDNNGGVFTPFDPNAGIGGLEAVGGLEATALNYTVIQRQTTVYDPQDDVAPLVADEDDTAPINFNDANSGAENSYRDTNVMIVLDISGSMREDADSAAAGVQTRLSVAKAALANLLHTYETLGDVQVTLVTFNKTASIPVTWGSVADAIAAMEAIILDPKAVTNYTAALQSAETAWENPGKLTGDVNNVVYFVSDGKPTWGGNNADGNHLTSANKTAWDAFLEDPSNGIDHVYAVGIGDDVVGSPAAPDRDLVDVADPDRDHVPANDVLYVTDPTDLDDALGETIDVHTISGNVIDGSDTSGVDDNAAPGDADVPGNGATHIYTLSHDGDGSAFDVEFSWDGSAANVSQIGAGGTNVVISGRDVSFDTEGGRMTFHFDTGDYTFTPGVVTADTELTFHYGTRDADGDVDLPGGVDDDTPVGGGADLVLTITNTPDEVPEVAAFFAPTSPVTEHDTALLQTV